MIDKTVSDGVPAVGAVITTLPAVGTQLVGGVRDPSGPTPTSASQQELGGSGYHNRPQLANWQQQQQS